MNHLEALQRFPAKVSSIGFEGGICSGKSTISSRFFSCLTPSIKLPDYFELTSKEEETLVTNLNDKDRFYFFLGLDNRRNKILQSSEVEGNKILLDRTFLTILATEYAFLKMGRIKIDPNYILECIENCIFWTPDIIFFLDVAFEERLMRYNKRGTDAYEPLISEQFYTHFNSFFYKIKNYFNFYFIDTTHSTPEEVFQLCAQAILENKDFGKPSIIDLFDELKIIYNE